MSTPVLDSSIILFITLAVDLPAESIPDRVF